MNSFLSRMLTEEVMMPTIGLGAGVAASYATGGGLIQSAAMGLAGGAIATKALPAMANVYKDSLAPVYGQSLGGFKESVDNMANSLLTPEGRNYGMGMVAGLSAFSFGGNKTLKSGFNKHRGNSIGR